MARIALSLEVGMVNQPFPQLETDIHREDHCWSLGLPADKIKCHFDELIDPQ
jgi:hypothetical protein